MKELDSILKNIKNKELAPIYFFHGEEPYFIDIAVKAFENDVLEEDEKAFNQTVVYGKDTTYGEVLSLARQFPMMGDRQLIIVKEAQDLGLNESESEALETYLKNPVPSTVLVFAYKNKKLDGKRKITKSLNAAKVLYLSEKIRDYEVSRFIQGELSRANIKTTPNISVLLAEYLGTDLSRIANEISKLRILLKEGEILDEKLVELHIGISKEFNVFELQSALAEKNAEKAFKIAHYMSKNPKTNPLVMLIGTLFSFFSKLVIYQSLAGRPQQEVMEALNMKSSYPLKDYNLASRHYNLKHSTRIISILREIDLKGKGLGSSQTDTGELLKELVFKIINIDKTKVKV